jgi:hypothetical protein
LVVGTLALALFATAPSASAQDISGAWDVTLITPQGENSIEATLKQDGEAISGQITSPLGTVDIAGTLVKNALNVGFAVPVQGSVFEVKMTGKVEGDLITGTADFGGMGEAPWTAKRKPVAAATTVADAAASPADRTSSARPGDLTGKWDMVLSIDGVGDLPMTGTFTVQGEKLTGTLSGPQGELPVTGTMLGRTIRLEFTAPTPNGEIPVTMDGELGADDGLAGKASLGSFGEAPWSGKRAKQ